MTIYNKTHIPSKSEVREEVRDFVDESVKRGESMAESVRQKFEEIKSDLPENMKRLEDRIQKNPGSSVAIAFAAGLVLSLLIGHRGHNG
jgi:ElaB/YqjD/DUF883 family membrane-anchored ribosome-binding protein